MGASPPTFSLPIGMFRGQVGRARARKTSTTGEATAHAMLTQRADLLNYSYTEIARVTGSVGDAALLDGGASFALARLFNLFTFDFGAGGESGDEFVLNLEFSDPSGRALNSDAWTSRYEPSFWKSIVFRDVCAGCEDTHSLTASFTVPEQGSTLPLLLLGAGIVGAFAHIRGLSRL